MSLNMQLSTVRQKHIRSVQETKRTTVIEVDRCLDITLFLRS
jgi:hypothetical protein